MTKTQDILAETPAFAEDMFSDLNDLEEMTFDDAELQEADKEQKAFDLASFMVDIENLLPEFNDFFNTHKHNLLESILDKSLVETTEQETAYAQMNDHKNIKFNHDDDVINAIFNFLSYDLLAKRVAIMQAYYREHLIKIHKECSDTKTMSLPIVEIQESISSSKPTLATKPKEFIDYLVSKNQKDKFFEHLPQLKWENVTKASYNKLFELMKVAKSDDIKKFYKELEDEGIIKQSGGGSTYKVSSKLES